MASDVKVYDHSIALEEHASELARVRGGLSTRPVPGRPPQRPMAGTAAGPDTGAVRGQCHAMRHSR